MGFVRHAFVLSFYYLLSGKSYEQGMREIIQQGGDTDTNAAIVGGMLGALYGLNQIPIDLLTKAVQFDCTKPQKDGLGRKRPAFLSLKHEGIANIKRLLELRPDNNDFIIE